MADSAMPPLLGLHLIVDGLSPRCATPSELETLTEDAIRLSNMHLIAGPFSGVDGQETFCLAILAESHCSVHIVADPETYRVYFDLYSCKKFNPQPVIALVKKALKLDCYQIQCLERHT